MYNKVTIQMSSGQEPDELKQQISERNWAGHSEAKNHNWLENYKIERGNPVRVYEGDDFKLKSGGKK